LRYLLKGLGDSELLGGGPQYQVRGDQILDMFQGSILVAITAVAGGKIFGT